MTAIQEHVPRSRPLWTTRENLILASAVYASGEQNWMSVSRTMAAVAVDNSRPTDFFSQKSCAVQYGVLLENTEPPKRKKRLSETAGGSSDASSPANVETTTESIVRRLTEDRINELKAEIYSQQEDYAQLMTEIALIESGELSDEQILGMWQSIEKQEAQQRIEEMTMENQEREREQRRQERNWRNVPSTSAAAAAAAAAAARNSVTAMDVVDDESDLKINNQIPVDAEKKTHTLSIITPSTTATSGFQQSTATSPLLSSLLKSPTSGTAPTTVPVQVPNSGTVTPIIISSASSVASSNSVRTTAPTITTLLTSGSIPNANQPVITLKSIAPNKAAHLLARPISGPPTEALSLPPANSQSLLSPSQSAPTLSMLLEKSKGNAVVTTVGGNGTATQIRDVAKNNMTVSLTNINANTNTDCNDVIPMDIEDDLAVNVVTAKTITTTSIETGSDETTAAIDDPNEEQQLLEVFKNIGDMDELGIDVGDVIDDAEADDILKGVDEEDSRSEAALNPSLIVSPSNAAKNMDEFVDKKPWLTTTTATTTASNSTGTSCGTGNEAVASSIADHQAAKDFSEDVEEILPKTTTSKKVLETTTTTAASSDDSNDNIPLAAVASLESTKNMSAELSGSLEDNDGTNSSPHQNTFEQEREPEENHEEDEVEDIITEEAGPEETVENLLLEDEEEDDNVEDDDDDESDKLNEPPLSIESATKIQEEDSTVANDVEEDTTNHDEPEQPSTGTQFAEKEEEQQNDEQAVPKSEIQIPDHGLTGDGEDKSLPVSESCSDVIVIPTDDDEELSNGLLVKKSQRESSEEPTEMGDSTEGEQGDTEQQQQSSEAGDGGEEIETEEEEDVTQSAAVNGEIDADEKINTESNFVSSENIDKHSNASPIITVARQKLLEEKVPSMMTRNQPATPAMTTSTISIMDTDDSWTTDLNISNNTSKKEEKTPNIPPPVSATVLHRKQSGDHHQSRQSSQHDTVQISSRHADNKIDEESVPAVRPPPVLRKLRERDRSESPMIDDDIINTPGSAHSINTGIAAAAAGSHRSRRRCSSTPLIDSIPNSPASSSDRGHDERETRLSKKSLLSLLNTLQHSKQAMVVQRALTDDVANAASGLRQKEILLRPIDLTAIKRHIEMGTTRTALELQRDLMLMCQNALMFYKQSSAPHKAALAFLQELRSVREFIALPHQANTTPSIIKVVKLVQQTPKTTPQSASGSASRSSTGSNSSIKGRAASRKSQRKL